jgi:hypothetical protein
MIIAFYKSTHTGLPGIYNRLVRWWTKGIYSHCELLFSDGICASSSYMDGGVRFKQIDLDITKWDFVRVPDHLEVNARLWFKMHQGDRYDLLGNLHFVIGAVSDDKNKWFCSEAVASALGIKEAWRFSPNELAAILNSQPPTGGFLFGESDE